MKSFWRSTLIVLFVFSFSVAVAFADSDPPGRVARLQYVSGAVSVQPHGQDDWVTGTVNRPLTNSDNVWTDKDSRAELNVGDATIRMNSETSLTITNISDSTVQVQLHQGTLNVRVRRLYGGEVYEIDSPNMAFTVQKTGEYRFDVDPDADNTRVTVWKGEGDVTGNGPAVRVKSNQQARFSGGTSLAHSISEAPDPDGFDDWARVRDRRQDNSVSARYVAPGTIGTEDLDDYGTWSEVPPYGRVWVPAVGPGWAPYHYGHWVWIDPWGWTWVDDAPWGFAPFHYGRWAYINSYWGWVPGPIYARPFWAPALVAWFGGPGWGVSFGFGGGLGWCPLGWGEPFFPWYGVGRGYFHNVNVYNTHITNINNITNNYYNNYYGPGARGVAGRNLPNFRYANAKAPGGLTAVPRDVVVNSRPVGTAAMHVPANALTNARAVSRVPVQPTRASALGPNAGRAAAAPRSSIANRPVVSRVTPPHSTSSMARGQGSGLNATVARNGNPRDFGVTTGPSNRNVPRPSQGERNNLPTVINGAGNSPRSSSAMSNRASQQPGNSHYVPRPPQNGSMTSTRNSGDFGRSSSSGAAVDRSPSSSREVPRPGSNYGNSGRNTSVGRSDNSGRDTNSPRNSNSGRDTYSPHSSSPRPDNGGYQHQSSPRASVPRPTGRVLPGGDYSGSRSSVYGPSGQSSRSESPRYSTPSRPQWGGGGSYDHGSYSRGGSYGGSSSGAYSRGGSSGGYSGGSRGGYSGGGGGGYSGGGGGHSSGGGGGHSSGGNGGGHTSSSGHSSGSGSHRG